MAKEPRFNVTFAADGSSMTYWAGAEAPATLNLASLSASVRRAAEQLGYKTAIVNTCAGAVKSGWDDAMCMAQMRRRASAWINDNWSVGSVESDFQDMVSAAMAIYGKSRGETADALAKKDEAWRKAFRTKHAVAIAQARVDRLQANPPQADAPDSDLFDI